MVLRGTPATLDVQLEPVVRGISCSLVEGTDESAIKVAYTPDRGQRPSWRRDDIVRRAKRTTVLTAKDVDG